LYNRRKSFHTSKLFGVEWEAEAKDMKWRRTEPIDSPKEEKEREREILIYSLKSPMKMYKY
jgi:hypothetical protein